VDDKSTCGFLLFFVIVGVVDEIQVSCCLVSEKYVLLLPVLMS
jgi:hypothetical protein